MREAGCVEDGCAGAGADGGATGKENGCKPSCGTTKPVRGQLYPEDRLKAAVRNRINAVHLLLLYHLANHDQSDYADENERVKHETENGEHAAAVFDHGADDAQDEADEGQQNADEKQGDTG